MNQLIPNLEFIVAVSDQNVLEKYLLNSPCLQSKKYPLHIYRNCQSAAQAFNVHALSTQTPPENTWWIWVHQDVYLPQDWDRLFIAKLLEAQAKYPRLGLLGLYGIAGHGPLAQRAGALLDRGQMLQELTPLPCLVDSLDELLIASKAQNQLGFDPSLGFDFYGTDIVLTAQEKNIQAAVIHAPCEHWSSTPQKPPFPLKLVERIEKSAHAFENKWRHRLPLTTPCFEIHEIGSTSQFLKANS
jgi:hypothetical protein